MESRVSGWHNRLFPNDAIRTAYQLEKNEENEKERAAKKNMNECVSK